MKALKKITSYLGSLALAGVVYAQQPTQGINLVPGGQFGVLGRLTIGDILSGLIVIILIIVSLIAFAFLVIGGVKWVTSGGDKEATASAQKTITAALIGLLIVFAAWAITRLIATFFNIEILKLEFGSITPSLPQTTD